VFSHISKHNGIDNEKWDIKFHSHKNIAIAFSAANGRRNV